MESVALADCVVEQLLELVWPHEEASQRLCMDIWNQQDIQVLISLLPVTEGITFPHEFPAVVQRLNGPCGLIAAVQAELLAASPGSSLSYVVARMLTRAAKRNGLVCVVTAIRNITGIDVVSFGRSITAQELDALHYPQLLSAPGGSIMLLYSLALTCGLELLRKDMSLVAHSPRPSLIEFVEDPQAANCNDALVCLALYGRGIDSFDKEFWPETQEGYSVGVLTSQDQSLHEPTPAIALRDAHIGVWVALTHSHWTVITNSHSWVITVDDSSEVTNFVEINGLCHDKTFNTDYILLVATVTQGAVEPIADTSDAHKEMHAQAILGSRNIRNRTTEYYVMCRPEGCFEGGKRPRALDSKWYCARCYLLSPQIYSYNDATSAHCKQCGGIDVEVGYGHWLDSSEVPAALLVPYMRETSPRILKVISCMWPGARLVRKPQEYRITTSSSF